MNKYHKANHVAIIITIVLAVVILGVVGYIFVSNLTKKESTQSASNTTNSTENTTQAEVDKTILKSIDETFGVKLSFSIPENWTYSSNKTGTWPISADKGSSTETISISSPDENIIVVYEIVTNGGLGGSCIAEETPEIKLSFVEKQDLSNFNDTVFIQSIAKENDKLWSWNAGLFSKPSTQSTAVGSHPCDLAFSNVIKLSAEKNVDLYVAYIFVKDKTLTDSNGMPTNSNLTQTDIENLFKSEDFIKAKNILLSTKYN